MLTSIHFGHFLTSLKGLKMIRELFQRGRKQKHYPLCLVRAVLVLI